jgi:glutaredoxin-dependent peroxiredoxin
VLLFPLTLPAGTSVAPSVGSEAPDFVLPSTAGSDLALSSLRGSTNVVLAFFPLAFTSVCTTEFCDFTQGLGDFAGASARGWRS